MNTSTPTFYDAEKIGTLFHPDMAAIGQAAAEANLSPAAQDVQTVLLLLIDMQVDFCHEQGALYVPGALEDIERVNKFIFRHADNITNIICTLDSHLPFQIFHPPWWADEAGNHPDPLTIISADDVAAGKWQPLVMPEFSRRYVQQLEEKAKKQLTIWPYHVLIGGMGNALDPALHAVIMWHSLARKTQPSWLVKGRVPESEYYSAIRPEIDVPSHPQGEKQTGFVETVREADIVFVAGEAESHCVLETLTDLVREFENEPDQRSKLYVLQDCMSPVQHPDVDFHALAQEQFETFAEAGVHFVNSSDDFSFLSNAAIKTEKRPFPVAHLHTMAEWNEKIVK